MQCFRQRAQQAGNGPTFVLTVFTSAESLRRAIRATIEKRINSAGKEPSKPAIIY